MAHVTIPSQISAVAYIAAAGQRAFPVPFSFFEGANLEVYAGDGLAAEPYVVTGTPGPDGAPLDGGFNSGTVTFSVGRTAGERIFIRRSIQIERLTDFPYPSRTLDVRALNTEFDRVYAILQDRDRDLDRALMVPPTEAGIAPLPPVSARANRYLAFDDAGNPVALEATDGGDDPPPYVLPGFLQTGIGAVGRPLYGKVGESLSAADFGVVADGVTDDTAAVRRAIAESVRSGRILEFGPGVVRLTSTIESVRVPRMRGQQVEPMATDPNSTSNYGSGSWFLFDHLGIGFRFGQANGFTTGGLYEGFGHLRPQTVPVAGVPFLPRDFDYDIRLLNCDIFIDKVVLLNTSRGILVERGAAGRLRIGSIMGQPLVVGIDIYSSYDVTSIGHMHFWPMWSTRPEVLAYMVANADALRTGRCDGLQATNLFAFGYKAGHRVYGQPEGTTLRATATNVYFDLCNIGIEVDASVGQGAQNGGSNEGAIITYENYVYSGSTSNPFGATAISVSGTGSDVSVTDFESVFSAAGAVRCLGTGNLLSLDGRVSIRNWGRDTSLAFPAIECTAGSSIAISSIPTFAPSASTERWSGSGQIMAPLYAASGTVSLGIGTEPAVIVTHGLGRAPRASEIQITLNSGMAGGSGWAVDGIGTQQFRLRMFGTTTAATFFNWKASLA